MLIYLFIQYICSCQWKFLCIYHLLTFLFLISLTLYFFYLLFYFLGLFIQLFIHLFCVFISIGRNPFCCKFPSLLTYLFTFVHFTIWTFIYLFPFPSLLIYSLFSLPLPLPIHITREDKATERTSARDSGKAKVYEKCYYRHCFMQRLVTTEKIKHSNYQSTKACSREWFRQSKIQISILVAVLLWCTAAKQRIKQRFNDRACIRE